MAMTSTLCKIEFPFTIPTLQATIVRNKTYQHVPVALSRLNHQQYRDLLLQWGVCGNLNKLVRKLSLLMKVKITRHSFFSESCSTHMPGCLTVAGGLSDSLPYLFVRPLRLELKIDPTSWVSTGQSSCGWEGPSAGLISSACFIDLYLQWVTTSCLSCFLFLFVNSLLYFIYLCIHFFFFYRFLMPLFVAEISLHF